MSDWGTQNATPTGTIQWENFWINSKKDNIDKHGKHCHQKKKKSWSFISVDGMIGTETLTVLTNLSRIISEKMEESILHVRGWFNVWIKI